MTRLAGRIALVTGGGRGIGRAVALALAREGASLVLAARTKDEVDRVAGECREAGAPRAEGRTIDLARGAEIDALTEALLAEHGAIDVLANVAGTWAPGNALEGDPDAWERVMAVNALAPMRLVRRLAPAMVAREQGTILSVSSIAALEGMKVLGAYAASKHALRGFSLSTYERLREHGIKVCLVHPAYVLTDMVAGMPLRADRLMSADDVAQAAMLAVTTSAACCPSEITLRLTRPAA